MIRKPEKSRAINIALLTFYLVGMVGLSFRPSRPLFLELVPWHLLLTLLLLMLNHGRISRPFAAWALMVFVFGIFIEWIGVKTGLVFGSYLYGPTLGAAIDGIPLIIGVNWLILAYCCQDISSRIFKPLVLKSVFASLLMTVLDYIIEPVAVALDFWHWSGGHIPFSNFAGWFVVSMVLFTATNLSRLHWKNPSSVFLYLFMLVFFITLRLTLPH